MVSPTGRSRRRRTRGAPRRNSFRRAHAGRAIRRCARGRAAGRSRGAGDRRGRLAGRGPCGGDRGRLLRRRQPGRRGQPQRGADGGSPRGPAGVGRGGDGDPPLRVRALSGRRGLPFGRRRGRGPLRGGRRRVDVAGAARDGEAGDAVPPREPNRLGDDPRLAFPEPAAGGDVPARVDGRDRRERRRALRRLARGAGRVRAAVAAALGRRGRGGTLRRRARRRRRGGARRAPAARDERGEARRAEARVPRGRQRHRRELERDQRRRGRARDRERGTGAGAGHRVSGRVRWLGCSGRRSSRDGNRARAGGSEAARSRGGERWGHRPRRAERGVRVSEPGRDPRARARSRARERQRRRDRARPSARHERRPAGRHAAARAPSPRRQLWARHALRGRRARTGSAIRTLSPARRYVELGLRLGKHDDDLVDSYYGPDWGIGAEEPRDPIALAQEAELLLQDVGEDPWLAAHVRALWTHARRFSGEQLTYAQEGELVYGIEPLWYDEAPFRRAADMLDEALPGAGDLRARLARWYEAVAVPSDILEQALRDVAAELRRLARETIGLPEGEDFELELVTDERWLGYAKYLGGLRTHISVNTDLPFLAADLVNLTSHEIYGGHHTHHVWQEVELVRGLNQLEWTITLLWSPSAVIAEGIATAGPRIVAGDGQALAAAVLERLGFEYDAETGSGVTEA